MYNPLAVPLVYFLYSRGCGRYGFGCHSPPCGRHGLILGPLSFVAVMNLAVIVAVMDLAVMVCGRHSRSPASAVWCKVVQSYADTIQSPSCN